MREGIESVDHACNRAEIANARQFEDAAIERLRSEGFRITMTRIQVIRALAETHRALSAYQIHNVIAASGGRIDVVSVYRILTTLQSLGLVHRIGIVDGFYACRMAENHPHHTEHFVCQECGCVTEIDASQTAVNDMQGAAKAVGFQPIEMRIEVLGTCAHCSVA
jgi:Fur family zinc uptake transcriptional regulator